MPFLDAAGMTRQCVRLRWASWCSISWPRCGPMVMHRRCPRIRWICWTRLRRMLLYRCGIAALRTAGNVVAGVDISKDACWGVNAHRICSWCSQCVSSAGGVEDATSCPSQFAPFAGEEYVRCCGRVVLLHAAPDAMHLWSRKRRQGNAATMPRRRSRPAIAGGRRTHQRGASLARHEDIANLLEK